jgi:hypothetical protein
VTPTAIAAAVPRRRTKVAGRVTDIACFARPWIRFDAKLSGFVVGRLLIAEGTPARTRGVLVILNPLYEFQS